jgi:hypothetical protein
MARTRIKLTPALGERICACIRSGGYAHVAAEAVGVPRDLFERWMVGGRKKGAREPYRSFAAAVAQAEAEARLRAETAVFKKQDWDIWLRCGPGKESGKSPGWTAAARPRGGEDPKQGRAANLELILELCEKLLEALEPFPEARDAAAAVIAKVHDRIQSEPEA